jgi:serine O-acetyltransferase
MILDSIEEMYEDVERAKAEDPAAPSTAVVLTCYSGLHALWNHRVEHWLWEKGAHGIARFMSSVTRHFTGIEIHPGAQIGKRVFIDHGMGVVIGETAIVGNDCTLYQGCTLGGTGKETGKRHPTIGDNVVVGVGASVLGNITVGDDSKIGGGAVVVDDVPPESTVVGIPGRVVRRAGKQVAHGHDREDLPDPIVEHLARIQHRIGMLERRVDMLRCLPGDIVPDVAVEQALKRPTDEDRALTLQVLADENAVREAIGENTLSREYEALRAELQSEKDAAEKDGAAGSAAAGAPGGHIAASVAASPHDAQTASAIDSAASSLISAVHDAAESLPDGVSADRFNELLAEALERAADAVRKGAKDASEEGRASVGAAE